MIHWIDGIVFIEEVKFGFWRRYGGMILSLGK